MINLQNKKTAIVYDWIDKWGGVERVLLSLHELFPQAVYFTSYYDHEKTAWAKDLVIKTSFIQHLPEFIKKSRVLSFPLYPYAFESFDFTGYDLVISVTSSFAKSVITKPGTYHICYLLTPMRYLWVCPEKYINNWQRKLLMPFFSSLKHWDKIVSQRPDKIVAISQTVANRCEKFYARIAEVVYPPFDLDYWSHFAKASRDKQKYFLIVSRLEPYKNVELAVNVFNQLSNESLVIIGEGSQKKKLMSIAKNNIKFLDKIKDGDLAQYYSQAEALIMPQVEDFGYTALEAQFFGCPVIAYGKGGALETVLKDQTGIFFDEQNEASLIKAIERFHTISYNLKVGVNNLGMKQCRKFGWNKFESDFMRSVSL